MALVMSKNVEHLVFGGQEQEGEVAPEQRLGVAVRVQRQVIFSLLSLLLVWAVFAPLVHFFEMVLSGIVGGAKGVWTAYVLVGISPAMASWLYFNLTPNAEAGALAGFEFAAVHFVVLVIVGTVGGTTEDSPSGGIDEMISLVLLLLIPVASGVFVSKRRKNYASTGS